MQNKLDLRKTYNSQLLAAIPNLYNNNDELISEISIGSWRSYGLFERRL